MENEKLSLSVLSIMSDNKIYGYKDFIHLGSYDAVRKCFSRLILKKRVIKLLPGLFQLPKYNSFLNEYEEPSIRELSNAYAKKMNWEIYPSGETALNLLGISTQIPNTYSFISNGPYKTITYKNIKIEFKHKNLRETSGLSEITAIVIQAIKEIGVTYITDKIIDKIRLKLTNEEKKLINKELKLTSFGAIIKKICED